MISRRTLIRAGMATSLLCSQIRAAEAMSKVLFGKTKKYLGQVATRTAILNELYSTNKQFNSRTSHTARVALSQIQVVFPNWYINTSFVEAGSGAAATITASVEYPTGTFTQIKFSGSASGTIPNGGNLISDVITLNIPQNAQFFVRTFWNCTAGILLLNGQSNPPCAVNNYTGEAINAAVSGLPDLTLGGTITDATNFAVGYRPAAIIGLTTKPSFLLLGDSRQFGYSNTSGTGASENVPAGEWAGSIDPYFGYINCGVPTDQANLFVASHTMRLALGSYCSHVGCEYGINDLDLSGYTSSQLISSIQSIINLFPGKPFFVSTLDPYSYPSNTAPNNPSANTQRVAYNTSLRAGTTNLSGLNGFFDIASVTESSLNSGLWNSSYSTDFLHPDSNGYAAITASGVINAALFHYP